jgi:hypothetical protein
VTRKDVPPACRLFLCTHAKGLSFAARTLLVVALADAIGCSPPPAVIAGNPPSFDYSSIAAKRIAFGRPVVVSSEIFYENRFTNQNYHSIDKAITQDAFFRDFKQAVLASGLGWTELSPRADSLIQARYAYVNKSADSLPLDVRRCLREDSVDAVVVVCAMRLYHRQLIGLRPGGSGYVNSYGADFVKKLEYTCSIFDVGKNAVVWRLPVMQEENSQSLGLFETSVRQVFRMLLRNRGRPPTGERHPTTAHQ